MFITEKVKLDSVDKYGFKFIVSPKYNENELFN